MQQEYLDRRASSTISWTGALRVLLIAGSLAAGACFCWLAVAGPAPVANAALGSDWQCSKTAFVLTTCRPL
ncbi:hypothetical protein JQ615_19500 [Bradyrhizobium jicamae]|uniref:Uncharacterized protein n=1 Tax=Bradyrhizobium jicamae TaxID=280332 RepID=A0ABS5FLC2_9BRAD|nr:hypothetical protein [Bradyrhizobium jicamae]MBR0797577.1 hypothetical protein [Bradyrhizobium jicamae]MBR0937241.1 hypothetical protein [Bradyrhizobium jicamae]